MIRADLTATAWRKVGEASREAVWSSFAVPCHIEQTLGETRGADGQELGSSLVIIEWGDLLDVGDRVAPYATASAAPTSDALTVTAVRRLSFDGQYHHSEVTCS